MPKITPTTNKSQLPNAPLVEVVFELKWNLVGRDSSQKITNYDPGFGVLLERFSEKIKELDFKERNYMSPGDVMYAGQSIAYRFFESKDKLLPILQIGPGIFASNESAAYEWKDFKTRTLKAMNLVFQSYPKLNNFSILPEYLELRYLDTFNSSSPKAKSLVDFLNQNTNLNISLPDFLSSKNLARKMKANLSFSFEVDEMKDTQFSVQISDVKIGEEDCILLTSKIISKPKNQLKDKTIQERKKFIQEWLESAHSITSPFFKDFVGDELMQNYKEN